MNKKVLAGLFLFATAFGANATLIDDFSVSNNATWITDLGGDSLVTSSGPTPTGTGWDRQIDLRATSNAIQNITAVTSGNSFNPTFLLIAETPNSKGFRYLTWDTLTPAIAQLNDVLAFDFKNVDQAFKLNIDVNAFNNPLEFIINPGDTYFMVKLSNWVNVGDAYDNISTLITSDNAGVDLELQSVSVHVPEAESIFMVSLGLLGLGLMGMNKKYHLSHQPNKA